MSSILKPSTNNNKNMCMTTKIHLLFVLRLLMPKPQQILINTDDDDMKNKLINTDDTKNKVNKDDTKNNGHDEIIL